jgi:hypothetical protein
VFLKIAVFIGIYPTTGYKTRAVRYIKTINYFESTFKYRNMKKKEKEQHLCSPEIIRNLKTDSGA